MPHKRASTDDVVKAAIRGGTVLMFVMTMQRALNFILNQLLLRYVDPAIFGIASIPLDLLLNTALFLSREGIRLALGRQTLVGIASDREEFRRFVNLSWVPALLTPIVSLLSLPLLPSDATDATLRSAGVLFCFSAALEGLSEPAYLVCQGYLITSLRAYSEGIATLVRSALTFVLLAYILPADKSILAFGLAQVGYSLTLLGVYWGYIIHTQRQGEAASPGQHQQLQSLRHMLPTASFSSSLVDTHQFSLSVMLTAQSLFKHLLTQGDKIVLSVGTTHYSQGLYALAQNYGSLAARLFFQPLEESGRLMFSRLAARDGGHEGEEVDSERKKTKGGDDDDGKKARGRKKKSPAKVSKGGGGGGSKAEQQQQQEEKEEEETSSVDTLSLMFGTLVKLVVIVGLIFACFGFNYTRVLLRILLPGKKWEGGAGEGGERGAAAQVLSWYCIYVLLLALNGMTEAFVYAVAAKNEVTSLSLSAALSFIVFAALTLPLMKQYGTVGLVLANSGGMIVRIAFSLSFISTYFRKLGRSLPSMMPHFAVLSTFVAAFAGTMGSDLSTNMNNTKEVLAHIGFGVMALLSVVVTIYFCEAEFLIALNGVIGRGGVVVGNKVKRS